MRRNGWQLPYHPLQVVAIAVFLALCFAYYVFFAPFLGKRLLQYLAIGLYTPLVACIFFLYIWCAATDPADPGVFKSEKYPKLSNVARQKQLGSTRDASDHRLPIAATSGKSLHDAVSTAAGTEVSTKLLKNDPKCCTRTFSSAVLLCPVSWLCFSCQKNEQSSEHQASEDGMFFCSLCKVEVLKYSKHCRVCDKCVDGFDHHCRWLNNCIGRKNYRRFFVLMTAALILLILQWTVGIIVLVLCFLERRKFSVDIAAKLGSSFTLVPFVVVVGSCTLLAMLATLPLAQLFFFHILLIKKGISTYDYIIALREQEQQELGGHQSPQMSRLSSFTGLSSTSSFGALHRGSLCTPPRMFIEDQFDVIAAEVSTSRYSTGKKKEDEVSRKKGAAGAVKISPWALARLNAEEVTRAAEEARKRSTILHPISRKDRRLPGYEHDSSFGSSSDRIIPAADYKHRANRRGRPYANLSLEPIAKTLAGIGNENDEVSNNLAPLQLEARSAFHPSQAASSMAKAAITSSPDSSFGSPDVNPFGVSALLAYDTNARGQSSGQTPGTNAQRGTQLSRSTSDGYEASGGEDSDRIPSRIVHRSANWANVILNPDVKIL